MDDWGVQSPPKRKVFRFHYHSQKVIWSLGYNEWPLVLDMAQISSSVTKRGKGSMVCIDMPEQKSKLCHAIFQIPEPLRARVTKVLWYLLMEEILYQLILQMGVSKNRGTPKSSILIGFSLTNHPFWGYPYSWKHPNRSFILRFHQGFIQNIPGSHPETNSKFAPENRPFAAPKGKEKGIPTIHFQGQAASC